MTTAGTRLHITGASGAGCSTLARGLAVRLASQCFDTDDFYWHPSDPPFSRKRPPEERLALMAEIFLPRSDWILAGSLLGWGEPLVPRFTHVVFLTLPPAQRLARLRRRERLRYGDAILPGGPQAGAHRAFMDYAMGYDSPDFTGRTRVKHELWLEELPCPVIRLDSSVAPDLLADRVIEALDQTVGAA
ncbi:AAA family ATPase [Rhodovulum kholense]|uniref:AAA domain-containing protein n=1 Tax=Rhodovulum kholense TaxID=453584 RepID=A0A8E2VM59_9RHOB|nr:AAA family ATPase [Rhodovulum kholense]PTW50178.1 AAA domain-containing protein [Rhodovulum kholense]